MLSKAFNRHSEENRLIRLVLIFVVLFAAAHVALHNLDLSGSGLDGHDECQVCRLNHVPVASLAPLTLFAPLQLLAYVLTVADSEYQLSHLSHTQWARAPPILIDLSLMADE